MKIETLSVDFTDEQKRYLEGFTTGLQISRVGRGFGGAAAGKANIVDVVTAVSETEVAIDAVVAVRDKVIAAYEEIMRMPI